MKNKRILSVLTTMLITASLLTGIPVNAVETSIVTESSTGTGSTLVCKNSRDGSWIPVYSTKYNNLVYSLVNVTNGANKHGKVIGFDSVGIPINLLDLNTITEGDFTFLDATTSGNYMYAVARDGSAVGKLILISINLTNGTVVMNKEVDVLSTLDIGISVEGNSLYLSEPSGLNAWNLVNGSIVSEAGHIDKTFAVDFDATVGTWSLPNSLSSGNSFNSGTLVNSYINNTLYVFSLDTTKVVKPRITSYKVSAFETYTTALIDDMHKVIYTDKDNNIIGKFYSLDGSVDTNLMSAPAVTGFTFTNWDDLYGSSSRDKFYKANYTASTVVAPVISDITKIDANYASIANIIGNNTTSTDIKNYMMTGLNSADVTLTLYNFNVERSTSDKKGLLTCTVIATSASNAFAAKTYKVNVTINKNGTATVNDSATTSDDLNKSVDKIDSYLDDDYKPSNNSSKSTLKKKLNNLVDKYDVDVTVEDWDLDDADKYDEGNLSFDLTLKDDDNNTTTYTYNEDFEYKSSATDSAVSSDEYIEDTNISTPSGYEEIATKLSSTVRNSYEWKDDNGNSGYASKLNNGSYIITVNDRKDISRVYIKGEAANLTYVHKWDPNTKKLTYLKRASYSTDLVVYDFEEDSKYVLSSRDLTLGAQATTATKTSTYTTTTTQTSNGVVIANSPSQGIGWLKENGRWIYKNAVGSKESNKWLLVSGKWYLFDANGYMLSGWQTKNGKWYFLNDGGDMLSGWYNSNGTWYYLNGAGDMAIGWYQVGNTWYYSNSEGAMLHDTYVGKYRLGSDGAWY